ncbi:MAG TPA: PspC domain-containing protein [Candidatus Cryptobacteroides merdipullorum]|uniref:PspC domain-containing protein n=1 Tax=Candidatus Cryptobacteroides merdipullorum TaxID=2840771 RepID=A0A9D1KGG7_9BACT|nr:PspC domain-containing protein [Candidatus Cryptobacteroides merdipullorum]
MTKRLTKSSNNRMIAGVCAGVANYFDVDPTVVRIAWAFLVVLFGSGLLLYLICWLLMPSDYGV